MPAIKLENLLASVFSTDGKTSMKADKAIKRAAKLAISNSTNGDASMKEIRKQLQALLSSGKVPGYKLDGERITKVELPAAPAKAPNVEEKKKKDKKEKKKKKRKRSSDTDTDDDNDNARAASSADDELREEKNKNEKKKKKKNKEKKAKKQRNESTRGQENSTPPASTPAPTPTTNNAITTLATTTTKTNNNAETPGGNEDLAWRASLKRTDVKSGPFSKTELDTIRSSVISWAQTRGLSTEDFSWIFAGTGQRSSDIRGLWKHVALALPRRTIKSVAEAGNRIMHPDANKGKWTPEEDEELRTLVAERGNKWLEIGTRLGRPRDACRVRWREIKLGAQKKSGKWSEEEEEKLKEVVNEYLQAKKDAERNDTTTTINNNTSRVPMIVAMPASGGGDLSSGGGASTSRGDGGTPAMTTAAPTANPPPSTSQKIDKRLILDDIDWSVVSERVGTRSKQQCLDKWYDQLAPSMIVRGDWGEGDDRRLLRSLWRAGIVAEFEVAWDGLVPDRTAQQARRRWRLMVKGVPDYKDLEFYQVVEYLVSKYLPQLKEKEPRGA